MLFRSADREKWGSWSALWSVCLTSSAEAPPSQNLNFLKKKLAISCFSPAPSGFLYLRTSVRQMCDLPFLEDLLDFSLGGLSSFSVFHLVVGQGGLEVEVLLDDVTGDEQVVVVHVLDKWLNS